MSRFHFHRVFKSVTGVTPKAYASAYRAGRVREELRGDVQLARGDAEAARQSYERALSLTDTVAANRNLLRLKFEDLATGSPS